MLRALARRHVVNKKDLSEADICDLFITPAVQRAGWDAATQIRREHYFTDGQVLVRGRLATRDSTT
jgi:type I restriction enzyme R subunit